MRNRLLSILLVLLVTGGFAFAQEETAPEEDPTLYAMTVYLTNVYRHSLGYKVDYNSSDLYLQEAYLPGRWFTSAAGKGELVYETSDSVPYMVVYYENGAFTHLRLYVPNNPFHSAWDQLPAGTDLSDEFSVEEPQIDY